MNLIVRVFGHEVLNVSTDTACEEAEYDTARDLSGGTTGIAAEVYATGDRYMGFTNGRDDE